MTRVKSLFRKFKKSIWLYPTVISILSFGLALIIYYLDRFYASSFAAYLPVVLSSRVELVRSVHAIIAAAFITIMTFTFSTTMVVLTMYMSQLSPRVVENFLTNHSTMQSLAVFVGGFIYAIVSLLLSNNIADGSKVVSGGFSLIYIIVGILFFIVFVDNVAKFIQTSNIIERLYNEAKVNIKDYVNVIKDYEIHKTNDFINMPEVTSIHAKKSTYIQNVNYQRLHRIAEDNNGVIVFRKAVGDFVYRGEVLATIHADDGADFPENIESIIRACYVVGDQRTENQDYNYSIQKIVEVALRAMSPGINDPNTAIHCIRMISVILEDLIHFESGYIFMDEGADNTGLIFEIFNLEKLLNSTYNQIVHYGSSDASIMLALIKSIDANVKKATTLNRVGLLNYAEFIWERIELNIDSKYEIKFLERAMSQLRTNINAQEQ